VADTKGDYNTGPATFKIDVKAPVSGGGGSQPPANQPPVADAGGPYTVEEGGSVALAGSGSDPDGTIESYDWDFDGDGQFDDATGQTPTFSAANLDGPSDPDPIVALRVTDNGGTTATDTATVHVDNVPPTILSMTPSTTNALSGTANKVTYTGVADDPANADDAAGFTWAWSGGTSTDTDNNSSYQTSFSDCGTKSVSATATDKDNGTSPSRTTSGSELVNVYNANFLSPLKDGTVNKVQKGQVVPVKISIGCNGTNLTGLSPNIQLLSGNQSPETEAGTETLTTSVSSADTGQTMRPVDGGYIYNLAVPKDSTATVGKQYTVRVNPFGATANNAASGMYVVIEIRK
jgi:hypothetical protein